MSDHKIVKCKKTFKTTEKKTDHTMKRVYKRFIIEDFLTDLFESNIIHKTTRTSCINKAAESFTRIFTEILDKHAPLKVIQKPNNYCPAL